MSLNWLKFIPVLVFLSSCTQPQQYVASKAILDRLQPEREIIPARKGCDVCHKIFAENYVYKYYPIPISHKSHAKLGLECVFCHRDAASSAKADDYLMPAGHGFTDNMKMKEDAVDRNPCRVCHIYSSPFEKKQKREARCRGCHPSYVADKPLPYKLVKFRSNLKVSHKAHYDRGIPCLRCHVGIDSLENPVQSYVPKMDLCYECHKSTSGSELKPAQTIPLERVVRLYRTNCGVCHGTFGKGDGPMTAFFPASLRPRDLTDASHMVKRTDSQIYEVISKGGLELGLSEKMPGWEGLLTDEEIHDLVKYIRDMSKTTSR